MNSNANLNPPPQKVNRASSSASTAAVAAAVPPAGAKTNLKRTRPALTASLAEAAALAKEKEKEKEKGKDREKDHPQTLHNPLPLPNPLALNDIDKEKDSVWASRSTSSFSLKSWEAKEANFPSSVAKPSLDDLIGPSAWNDDDEMDYSEIPFLGSTDVPTNLPATIDTKNPDNAKDSKPSNSLASPRKQSISSVRSAGSDHSVKTSKNAKDLQQKQQQEQIQLEKRLIISSEPLTINQWNRGNNSTCSATPIPKTTEIGEPNEWPESISNIWTVESDSTHFSDWRTIDKTVQFASEPSSSRRSSRSFNELPVPMQNSTRDSSIQRQNDRNFEITDTSRMHDQYCDSRDQQEESWRRSAPPQPLPQHRAPSPVILKQRPLSALIPVTSANKQSPYLRERPVLVTADDEILSWRRKEAPASGILGGGTHGNNMGRGPSRQRQYNTIEMKTNKTTASPDEQKGAGVVIVNGVDDAASASSKNDGGGNSTSRIGRGSYSSRPDGRRFSESTDDGWNINENRNNSGRGHGGLSNNGSSRDPSIASNLSRSKSNMGFHEQQQQQQQLHPPPPPLWPVEEGESAVDHPIFSNVQNPVILKNNSHTPVVTSVPKPLPTQNNRSQDLHEKKKINDSFSLSHGHGGVYVQMVKPEHANIVSTSGVAVAGGGKKSPVVDAALPFASEIAEADSKIVSPKSDLLSKINTNTKPVKHSSSTSGLKVQDFDAVLDHIKQIMESGSQTATIAAKAIVGTTVAIIDNAVVNAKSSNGISPVLKVEQKKVLNIEQEKLSESESKLKEDVLISLNTAKSINKPENEQQRSVVKSKSDAAETWRKPISDPSPPLLPVLPVIDSKEQIDSPPLSEQVVPATNGKKAGADFETELGRAVLQQQQPQQRQKELPQQVQGKQYQQKLLQQEQKQQQQKPQPQQQQQQIKSPQNLSTPIGTPQLAPAFLSPQTQPQFMLGYQQQYIAHQQLQQQQQFYHQQHQQQQFQLYHQQQVGFAGTVPAASSLSLPSVAAGSLVYPMPPQMWISQSIAHPLKIYGPQLYQAGSVGNSSNGNLFYQQQQQQKQFQQQHQQQLQHQHSPQQNYQQQYQQQQQHQLQILQPHPWSVPSVLPVVSTSRFLKK
ncbi:hypothetical protein HK100_003816 [Physocladia obscura]|uniref:Uncharacterized protein n=1 Tax=Physocladia obscura TaxID=109957 RepID=A0AAD5SZM2_9FUNG|nr:hypothetical protein HK100_003816 [Physocladia obscura]